MTTSSARSGGHAPPGARAAAAALADALLPAPRPRRGSPGAGRRRHRVAEEVVALEVRPGAVARVRRHRPARTGAAPLAPLVVLAAWPQTLRSWDAHWPKLTGRGREVVAVELPGFGRTPAAARAFMRPGAQAALLGELLGLLGLGPAVVVAPDVGVPVALRLAQDDPARVAGLVVFAGPGTARPHLAVEGRLLARHRAVRAVASVLGVAVATELLRRGYRRGRPPARTCLDHLRSAASPRRFAGQLAFVGSYPEELPALAARLGDVRAPVLVPWGAEDVVVLPAEGRALAAALPRAEHRELAGCGHYAHEDAGPAFTRLLEDWLGRVEREAAAA